MSTPNENPGPDQPGHQPPAEGAGSQPAPGYQPPQQPDYQQPAPGYQPPQQPGYQQPAPGYQPPQQPGYQQPAPGYQQPRPGGDFKFEMPTDAPHNFSDVMPRGGFSGLFNTTGLPTLLKVSYLIWIIGAAIWLLTTILGLIFSVIAMGASDQSFLGYTTSYGAEVRASGIRGLIVSIIALILIAAIVVCAMKLKEGLQWPRLALTIIAVLSLILIFFGAFVGILPIIATILMWLPESSAWLNSRKGLPA